MLLIEEIDSHYLLSLGFSKARISNPEQTLKQLRSINIQADLQLVKADLIAGPEHLQFAARNALYSFRGKQRRSKSLAMELLLYISCQRQIAKAIKILGVDSEDSRIALVALSGSKDAIRDLDRHARLVVDGEEDDDLIEVGSKQKMAKLRRSYGIQVAEMESVRFEGETDRSVLKRLIVERSALLDIED
jgi:tRNA threonylcarbamoyladenosine modification (KEOPS) complex Cgi121 subunit